ncbi:transcriptional regulator [Acetobacter orleanensis]|nr:transcriptional regulator [Acetobacter orleanensis]
MNMPFDIARINEVIHGRVRLGIMTLLVARGGIEFKALRDFLSLTDGNLSTHLRKLEDAGYIVQEKTFVGRKPLTSIALTETGRVAFLQYLDAMRVLLRDEDGIRDQLDES